MLNTTVPKPKSDFTNVHLLIKQVFFDLFNFKLNKVFFYRDTFRSTKKVTKPWIITGDLLLDIIRKHKCRRYVTFYKKLAEDGLHPFYFMGFLFMKYFKAQFSRFPFNLL